MAIVRAAQEQIDLLQAGLGILQTVTEVLKDPARIAQVRQEFLDAVALGDVEVAKREELLSLTDNIKTESSALDKKRQLFEEEHKASLDRLEAKHQALFDLQDELEKKHADANDREVAALTIKKEAEAKVESITEWQDKLTTREGALADAVAALNKREAVIKDLEVKLAAREEAVASREAAVTAKEKQQRQV